jgi:tetratricopeptide (TPR) repeat protein
LQQRPREQQPAAWATTKHHLACLLTQLGLEQNDSDKLRQAIADFQEALEVRTLSSSSQDWVATQHALGRAWDALGRRESGVRALECAIEAYVLALSQCPRELAALDWAVLQFDLGNAWLQIGYRLQQAASLQSATQAYRAALQVFDAEQQSTQWTQASHRMAAALHRVGELGGHRDVLLEAVQTYEQVLTRKGQTLSPHDLATVLDGLLACQFKRAALSDEPALLVSAIDVVQRHLLSLDERSAPAAQMVRKLLAQAWLGLALDHGELDALVDAVAVAQTWLNNTADAPGSMAWLQVQLLLATATTAQALTVTDEQLSLLRQAKALNRDVLNHVDRQSHVLEWALATGNDALCDWVLSIALGQREPAAALAVLTQVMAILWRADPQVATRMERAHAQVQCLARRVPG